MLRRGTLARDVGLFFLFVQPLRGRASKVMQLLRYTMASQGLRISPEADTDVPSCVRSVCQVPTDRRHGAGYHRAVLSTGASGRSAFAPRPPLAQRQLLFSSVVELMQAVVLGAEPSVFAAYRKRQHTLPVSDQSIYKKLKGIELGVSQPLGA